MLDFFSSLMSYIETIWSFFLNLIETLVTFITTLTQAALLPPMLLVYVWAPIGTCILSVAGFAVVKMIIGRSNV